jgi:uncharacterized protein YmfQ (DUF2313 family)
VHIVDAIPALLPPVAYDVRGLGVRREAGAIAAVLTSAESGAQTVLREQQPDRAVVGLEDWERNYALPDSCSGGVSQTLEQRRTALRQRIAGRGDLSRGFMIALAATIGYAGATIDEFGPTTCAHPCDSPVLGFEWIGVWRMNLAQATSITETTCEGASDAPLRVFGNTQLECVINRRKPAHTLVMFGYAS